MSRSYKSKRNMATPSWWVRMMMTRPQRQATRAMIGKVLRLKDVQDAPIFPHPKKPHLYYW